MTTRPATVNFRWYPNATFSEEVTLLDSNQDPVDLSGRSARMSLKRDRDDAAPILTLSTLTGSIVLGADGTIKLAAAADETYPALTPPIDQAGEVWYHDILIVDDAGTVERLYQGVVIVLPGITAPA